MGGHCFTILRWVCTSSFWKKRPHPSTTVPTLPSTSIGLGPRRSSCHFSSVSNGCPSPETDSQISQNRSWSSHIPIEWYKMPLQLGQIASMSFKSACGFTVIEKPSVLLRWKSLRNPRVCSTTAKALFADVAKMHRSSRKEFSPQRKSGVWLTQFFKSLSSPSNVVISRLKWQHTCLKGSNTYCRYLQNP